MTERDPAARIVLSWLREDAHENAERVLLRALDEVDTTPQRRSRWPAWRTLDMNPAYKIGLAGAAVLVTAIVGYNLLPRSGPIVGTASPAPTSTLTAPPSTPTAPPPSMAVGPLAPGTYLITDNTYVPYEITVPLGWRLDEDGYIARGDPTDVAGGTGVSVTTWIVSHIYADSCDWQGTFRPVGTKALMITELGMQAGHTTSAPRAATFGGEPATLFTLSLDEAFDVNSCDLGIVRLWPDPGPDESGGLRIFPGQTRYIYIIEQDGKVLLGVVTELGNIPRGVRSQLEDIVGSIDFQN